ncbi:hypothetical protein BDR04DRAFT_1104443 [Suillus decipiens]|nr:hypothetical protein BDR04DRAFT_1104443 [Suillus decipiens]
MLCGARSSNKRSEGSILDLVCTSFLSYLSPPWTCEVLVANSLLHDIEPENLHNVEFHAMKRIPSGTNPI